MASKLEKAREIINEVDTQMAELFVKRIVRISRDRDLIYDVTSREFEEIVAQLLKDEGFETLPTNSTRDGGRDIIATKAGINGKPVVFYVECKPTFRINLFRFIQITTSDKFRVLK